jgi:hypothetical protein
MGLVLIAMAIVSTVTAGAEAALADLDHALTTDAASHAVALTVVTGRWGLAAAGRAGTDLLDPLLKVGPVVPNRRVMATNLGDELVNRSAISRLGEAPAVCTTHIAALK